MPPYLNRRQFMQRTLGASLALGAAPTAFPAPALTRISAMNLSLDTATWTPFCFGRLMMLLPPGSKTGLRSTFWTKDLTLREDLKTKEQLLAEVRAKEQAFKSQKHQDFGNRYIRTYDLEGKGISVWGYERERINRFDNTHSILIHNYFFSEQPFRVWYLTDTYPHTATDVARDYFAKLARELRPLAEGEVPKEPGFVVPGGIVRTQEWRAEGAKTYFHLPFFNNPIDPSTSTVGFNMDSLAMGVNGDRLLDRISPIQSALAAFSGTRVIRKGERTINGLTGDEYLYREKTKDGRWTAYAFLWEMPGKAENVYQPNIKLSMDVTVPVTVQFPDPPFQSDEEALAFWDAVTGTLRLRPMQGPGGQTVAPDGSPPPTARVGQACPRGGIWEATLPPSHEGARALASSHYRFKEVAASQPMPQMYSRELFGPSADTDNAAVTWRWSRASWSA